MTAYETPDDPKMLRETLCLAQTALLRSAYAGIDYLDHVGRLQRLIDACDAHRPLGPDGKHGSRHTATCGCEDKPLVLSYGRIQAWCGHVIRPHAPHVWVTSSNRWCPGDKTR